jgi:hypothetical protein
MLPAIDAWNPIEVHHIQRLRGEFNNWCLCGGKSLDLLFGRITRDHGDTDIGVFVPILKTA